MACQALVERLEQALREAKLLHLHCGEVLLPHDLIWRIADQVITASDYEPCGLRGCLIYIHLQVTINFVDFFEYVYEFNLIIKHDLCKVIFLELIIKHWKMPMTIFPCFNFVVFISMSPFLPLNFYLFFESSY